MRKIIFWIMAWGTLTYGQSFTVDVDYQLQRQYRGPLLKHEVFTNMFNLVSYIQGGTQSRAYAGQVVVLIEGERATAYLLEPDGNGLMAKPVGEVVDIGLWAGSPAATNVNMGAYSITGVTDVVTATGASLTNTVRLASEARSTNNLIPFDEISKNPWYLGTDDWQYGFEGVITSNSVWINGTHYAIGGYQTSGDLIVGKDRLTGLSTDLYGKLGSDKLDLSLGSPLQIGTANIRVANYDLIHLQIDGSYEKWTELQNPRMIVNGGFHADVAHSTTNTYGGDLVILGNRITSAGAGKAGKNGVALGFESTVGTAGLAAGSRAIGADGAFVFADSQKDTFDRGTRTNSFSVRAEGGTYFETSELEVSGDIVASGSVQLGTALGTNVIAGDTQIGNSERLLDINQYGLFISDAVSEETEFAVEQLAPGNWRVDLKGNPLINAGEVSAESVMLGGEGLTNWPATVLEANKGQWALDAYSPPEDFVVETNGASITIKDYAGPGGMVRIPPYIDGLPVTVIFWNAFSADNEILHIVVPPTVTEIQERGIYECDNLISVDLGGSITVVPNSLFARCYALEEVTGLDRVTHIEPFGFHSSGLKEVHFGSTVTNIGQLAFYNCPSLTAVYFEGDAPITLGSGVLSQSLQATVYYRSGSSGFGEAWPPGGSARPTAIFGPLPASGANVFGQSIAPDSRGILQIPAIVELVFTTGDRLRADGQKLFYVSQDNVTNEVTLGGGPASP